MVVLNKIYTKTGDKGITSLGDGSKVSKDGVYTEALGAVDELNAAIGIALCYIENASIRTELQAIQNDLFDCGADICVPQTDKDLGYTPLRITSEATDFLEKKLDQHNADLESLNSFILPGGTKGAAYLHLARTVARRAEREIVKLSRDVLTLNPYILTFLNRLSDYLFVVSRSVNNCGRDDILWVPAQNRNHKKEGS